MLVMYKKLRNEVKKQIKCNSTESIKNEKDPMKIRLDSYDDDLPLNKILWFSDYKYNCKKYILYHYKYNRRICFSN